MGKANPYAGDSPAKKVSRLAIWWEVRSLLSNFLAGRYLVLASGEAGDVSVLRGLGVALEQITAVDWDIDEANKARLKFPGLRVHDGDVAKVVQEESYYSCAFLDFCGHASHASLDRIARIARSVRDGGIIGCGFEVGREKSTREDVLALRDQFREKLALTEDKNEQLAGMASYLARAHLIKKELWERGLLQGRLILPKAFFFYQGKTEMRQGAPMCMYLASVRKVSAASISFFKDRELPDPKFHFYEEDLASLREYALMLAEDGERADLLLNVPASSIAAWKAHATRGTYKRK